jgi:SAM-dependent methyltransferase
MAQETSDDRATLAYKIRRAITKPHRIVPYFRRVLRNRRLRSQAESHTEFYRAVMHGVATQDSDMAVGSFDRGHWMEVGKLQFDYLLKHGLAAHHQVLDIGCGNLRAGWRIIEYLEPGNYHGIDISPDILLAGLRTIEEFGLQHKVPYLFIVEDLRFSSLPTEHFDVVHAHSVFSHAPLEVLDECMAHVSRIMKPSGFFDFTWLLSKGDTASFLHEDFYHPREQVIGLARRHGFDVQEMKDWVYVQSKLRLRKHAR